MLHAGSARIQNKKKYNSTSIVEQKNVFLRFLKNLEYQNIFSFQNIKIVIKQKYCCISICERKKYDL